MLSAEERAVRDIPHLKRHLEELVALSARAFSPLPEFSSDNHMAFMAFTFAVKQNEHARSVLLLEASVDAVLITRSMFEGLCQLLWAAQAPAERPMRWRAFAYVLDWRRMRSELAAGRPVTAEQELAIGEGLQQYGRHFLSRQALDAEQKGASLPDDPYSKNWYGEKEKEIFSAVGAEVIYEEVYSLLSEWHHRRLGAFGQLFRQDDERATFVMSTRNASFTAMAVAGAFECLWETMSFLDNTVLSRIRAELDQLHKSYVAARGE